MDLALDLRDQGNEAAPITLGNPNFEQVSIANRADQLAFAKPNSGNWDMNTVNETGPHKGRFLYTVFETGQAGVQRHDLQSGLTDTIWHSLASGGHGSFDACFWTPWGTLITAEESWETGQSKSPSGNTRNRVAAPLALQLDIKFNSSPPATPRKFGSFCRNGRFVPSTAVICSAALNRPTAFRRHMSF